MMEILKGETMDYDVLVGAGRTLEEAAGVLRAKVAKALLGGWALCGGIAVTQNGKDYVDVAQAMVRGVG